MAYSFTATTPFKSVLEKKKKQFYKTTTNERITYMNPYVQGFSIFENMFLLK